jgi:multidrug efflux system membrane fusion protein
MRRVIYLLILLGAIGGGAYYWFTVRAPAVQEARTRRPPDGIPVVVTAATQRDVPIFLDGLGTAQASAMVTVKPQVDGKLLEVLFTEGQDVKQGDILARIDPRTYQAALDQAVAKKRQDEATLANARLDLIRYQKLAASAYTSAQTSDTQKSLVAQLEAQVSGDQAQIDTARTQLSYTAITAPVSGRAGIRQVDAGNIVHASDTTGLVVITTLKPISVLFTLPQQALAQVAAAVAAGTPEAIALPQAAGNAPASPAGERPILDRGTLTVLDNQVDPSTGTIKLKASFPNENLRLWPGAFVTVRLKVETRAGAVVVPPVAVQRGPQGTYIYVANDDMTASRRPVTISHEDLTGSIVATGLRAGEKVVIDGAARLSDKAKINILPPAGEAPAAAPGAPVARGPRPNRAPTGG